jgi:hypothetical protein
MKHWRNWRTTNKVTEPRRYCKSCNRYMLAAGGKLIVPKAPRAVPYWKCLACIEKRSPSPFQARSA